MHDPPILSRERFAPCASPLAERSLLWIIFSVSGALLTYLVAADGGPLYDANLAALDAKLGFDWPSWYDIVVACPILRLARAAAYCSVFWQITFSMVWLRWLRRITAKPSC